MGRGPEVGSMGVAEGGWSRWSGGATTAAVAVGATLRIVHWHAAGAFWGDEAALAHNLATRTAAQLFRPLDHWQAAPVGFLVLERWLGLASGWDEGIMRLLPLLAAIATLILGARAVRAACGPAPAAVATLLLACSPEMIRYAGELKPYASDAMVSVGLFALTLRAVGRGGWRRAGPLAMAGVVAPWFSLPSTFVLAAIGVCLIGRLGRAGHRRWALGCAALAAAWAASFGVEYALSLRSAAQAAEVRGYWSGSFAPFPPGPLDDWMWYAGKALYLLEPVTGRPARHLTMLAFLAGSVLLGRRDRMGIACVGSTIAATLAASALGVYPFAGRLLLFLMPLAVLPVAVAVATLLARPGRTTRAAGLSLLALLLLAPIRLDLARLDADRHAEDTRARMTALFATLKAEVRPGDRFVVGRDADWVFRYYAHRFGFAATQTIYLIDEPAARPGLTTEIGTPSGRRLWLLASTRPSSRPEAEADYLPRILPSTARPSSDRRDDALGLSLRHYEPAP